MKIEIRTVINGRELEAAVKPKSDAAGVFA